MNSTCDLFTLFVLIFFGAKISNVVGEDGALRFSQIDFRAFGFKSI